MKRIILISTVALAFSGCVVGKSGRLSSDRLARIQPGVTTRAQLNEWFGPPDTVGLDAAGRSRATWANSEITVAPYYAGPMKFQMLTVVLTNDVVHQFERTDQVNQSAEKVERTEAVRPDLRPKKAP